MLQHQHLRVRSRLERHRLLDGGGLGGDNPATLPPAPPHPGAAGRHAPGGGAHQVPHPRV